MTPEEVAALIDKMPLEERREMLVLLDKIEAAEKREKARVNFLAFVKAMWPSFIEGAHHRIMAEAFERVLSGLCKRLIINMAPRHTKSEFASYLLPAYFLGRFPDKKVIQSSHTAELAVGFGRKVRNLVSTPTYQAVFPIGLRADSKAAGRWNTSKDGEYFAIGVGGAVAGKGADLFIIDDPHSEQEAALAQGNPEVFDHVYEWYTSGPRQRLQPNAAIIVVMTRWNLRDLTGRLVKSSIEREGTDEWELIELPATLPANDMVDPPLPERSMWPEYWPIDELLRLKAELPPQKWAAQYQQDPTADEGALIKRDWWQIWEKATPPTCSFVIMSADTAFTKDERNDYSAFTVWGVFEHPDDKGQTRNNLILLDAWAERLEFPELKKRALEEYKAWEPDSFIVEHKVSGISLVQELRHIGVPVMEYTPVRGKAGVRNDKIARVNGITDIFASGMVWCPAKRFSDDVIEQCAAFPGGDHDDYVDSVVMALMRYRQGGFIRLPSDEEDEPKPRKRTAYY